LSALGALVPLGLALAAALAGRPGTALAVWVVGGACTEADLDAALAGGGVVTFNCGGPVTITLTSEKLITMYTNIIAPYSGGANRVTLDGAGAVRLFHVQAPATLVLQNDLVLVNGSAPAQGGAVLVDAGATLNMARVRFEHNRAANFGGAIGNYGRVLIIDSTFYSNSAPYNGGAIDSTGLLELAGSTFDQNYAGIRGGGVNNYLGVVRQWSEESSPSAFMGNRSDGYGGALVNDAGTLTLTSNFTDNHSSGAGGAFKNSGQAIITGTFAQNSSTGADGGAIWNNLSLVVGASAFTGNIASQGGAIYNDAVVTVTASTFSGNRGSSKAGAIFVAGPARLSVRASVFTANTSVQGETIYALGRTAIDGSTFHANGDNLGNAGVIETWTRLDVLNSTFSQNHSYHAGAIFMQNGLVLITNTTFVSNTAYAGLPNGGNIMVSSAGLTPSLRLLNSVLAGGAPNNCSDPMTSMGGNVEDAYACGLNQPSDKPNTDPRLGPLQDNGGAAGTVTLTHLPLPGSPAIDAALIATCPPVDQRGFHRPVGPGCDSGAVEAGLRLWLPLIRR
jgi:hypothetical protein